MSKADTHARIDALVAELTEPTTTDNVWHIDTGAGFRNGRLTVARIDVDPIETVTMPTLNPVTRR